MRNKLIKIIDIIAIIISNIMCATIAYYYCALIYQTKYEGASAPTSVAFLFIIPFAICLIICFILRKIIKNKIL